VGITEWLRIAALAHSFNASVSPHLMMEIHVHLVCATPNALFVEQVPMLERFLQHPLQIEGGYAVPPERPGHGVAFDQDKVSGYCLEKSSWQ
jgi:L-alanine-DL-glutamate epimerase-like enolase superfamily enzyme